MSGVTPGLHDFKAAFNTTPQSRVTSAHWNVDSDTDRVASKHVADAGKHSLYAGDGSGEIFPCLRTIQYGSSVTRVYAGDFLGGTDGGKDSVIVGQYHVAVTPAGAAGPTVMCPLDGRVVGCTCVCLPQLLGGLEGLLILTDDLKMHIVGLLKTKCPQDLNFFGVLHSSEAFQNGDAELLLATVSAAVERIDSPLVPIAANIYFDISEKPTKSRTRANVSPTQVCSNQPIAVVQLYVHRLEVLSFVPLMTRVGLDVIPAISLSCTHVDLQAAGVTGEIQNLTFLDIKKMSKTYPTGQKKKASETVPSMENSCLYSAATSVSETRFTTALPEFCTKEASGQSNVSSLSVILLFKTHGDC
eukprot:GHVT01001490.1.p1 GENE.GHVT01001490.1~~GHVT01001490.1.p1  ORF type:complete len:358 (-),score=18.98 GHVT01001490.1:243-1316(-)